MAAVMTISGRRDRCQMAAELIVNDSKSWDRGCMRRSAHARSVVPWSSLDACAIVSVSVLKFRAPQGTHARASAERRSEAARGQDARGHVSRNRANRPKGLLLARAVAPASS